MAGSVYKDDDDAGITDINVTPFVDVVLVLLVVFIVTAKLIVSRGVEIDPPKASAGGDVQSTLRVSLKWVATDKPCDTYVNGDRFTDDATAIARIKSIAAATSKPKAIIAGDRRCVYDGVMHLIDLTKAAGVTGIALENVRP